MFNELKRYILNIFKRKKDFRKNTINLVNINTEYTGVDCVNGNLPFYATFKNHDGYVATKWEQYLHIYNKIFEPYILKNEKVNLLEIGVQNGGSLQVWNEYFPKGSEFTGIDIDEKCLELKFAPNIHFLLGDASDKNFVEENFSKNQFDIIIDDGSHIAENVISSFELLFDSLKWGGLYVIEDCHTSYWDVYGGGYKNGHIEYFKNLVDSLNYTYIHPSEYNKVEDINRLENLNEQIASITFYDSVIVIEKYTKSKTKQFNNCITNGEGLVFPSEELQKGAIKVNDNTKFENFWK